MLFSSALFLWLFLPCVAALNFSIKKQYRNYLLLVASLIFYAWGEPKYILLMLLCTVLNWLFGVIIDKAHRTRLFWLFACVISKCLTFLTDGANERSLFMIRDSFGEGMFPYLSSQFNESSFVHVSNYSPEMISKYDPDIVVLEMVERYTDYSKFFTVQ